MATRKDNRRGYSTIIKAILYPRPILRITAVILMAAISEIMWVYMPYKLIVYTSGIAAPYCLLIAGAVWSMRDKADMTFDGDYLSAEQYKSAQKAADEVRFKSMHLAAEVAVMALVTASSAISAQITETIWQWMVIAGGVGVAEASYSYLLGYQWEEQLRAIRVRRILSEKKKAELQDLANRIRLSIDAPSEDIPGWPKECNGELEIKH